MPEESPTLDLVELQKRLTEAANRRDLDAVMSFYAPDALWESRPLGTSFAGAAAIRGFHEDWLAAYEEYEGQTEDILVLGNGIVLTVIRQTARPAGGTGHVRTRTVFVFE